MQWWIELSRSNSRKTGARIQINDIELRQTSPAGVVTGEGNAALFCAGRRHFMRDRFRGAARLVEPVSDTLRRSLCCSRRSASGTWCRRSTACGATTPSSPISASFWRRSGRKSVSISSKAISTAGPSTARNARSSISAPRANSTNGPFGTQQDVYGGDFEWINHSLAPRPPVGSDFRVTIGGPQCRQPYSTSIYQHFGDELRLA